MSRRTFKTGLWEAFKSGAQDAKKTEEQDQLDDRMPAIPDRTCNEVRTEEYQYSALSGGDLSLRLVELLPGTRQEDIACHMHETLLGDCGGSYEALSYVWGDTKEKTPIQINGRTLEIGTNLRLALLNLRLTDGPRILWIDAICINQGDIDERNQQLAIMGEIYSRAMRTVIWLRDQEEKQTEAAFLMLNDLADDAISLSQTQGLSTNSQGEGQNTVRLNNLPVSMIERDEVTSPIFNRYNNDPAAAHILVSLWWHRAWTVQEILLASSATIVVGRYSMDWDRFCVGANHGLNLGIWMPVTMGIIIDPIIMPFLSLQTLVWKRRMQDPKQPLAQVLLELLFHCRFREATDPRDKIYAFLGLVASSNPGPLAEAAQALSPLGIKPDYSTPTSTTYTYVTQQMILKSNTLDVLGACGASTPGASSSPILELPSWVPDWSITVQPATPLVHDALGEPRTTHATAHSTAEPQFIDADSTTLLLHAHEVTTLTALASPLAQIKFDGVKLTTESEKEAAEKAGDDSMMTKLALVGVAWRLLADIYEALMSVVPHLATYAEWEAFARAAPPTNPTLGIADPASKPKISPSHSIAALVRGVSNLGIHAPAVEEPDDPLAVYWQTLCTGTYETASGSASKRGFKIATQQLFYSWRASLKPIANMHRWHVDRKLRPLAFVGYVRKSWRGYGEFFRFIKGSYERRLGRAENGYLCLVPATAEIGDKVVLAKGGRVPLVLRRDGEGGYWRLVGEAYVHGIMDGEGWDESKCETFKVR